MVLFSKLFTALMLPPGIFILALFFAAIFSNYFKKTLLLIAISFYFVSTKFGSNLLLEPLEGFTQKDEITPKAVVVLSGSVNSKGYFKSYPETFKREVYALIGAKKDNLPLIFTGGGLNEVNEADIAKEDLEKLKKDMNANVPIYFENLSVNTKENAEYTSALFDEKHIPKEIYLVTSAYHMKRSAAYFKQYGFKVISKPSGYLADSSDRFLSFLPHMEYLNNSYKAVHEYTGLLLQLVKN